ncbi:DUF2905 domain-containing protein [Desulfotomaculum copahuensis]|uniref:DUF2905 domain-containing protein n=1 Tax=Desulfotomaculum copahuensis TaxID=1838280 RepID=A0A1B7LHX2_9FIRM|nr:DUF2905 domain-containing protein [Desulfotomaculum copahuensis]OAT85901.1 hypothetical protein A6M21_04355 [Desulfotomaculum copahuensis]
MGKMLALTGVFLLLIGGLLMASDKLLHLGRLPGDVYFHRGNFTFYFPVVTSIILSLLLTLVLNLIFRR